MSCKCEKRGAKEALIVMSMQDGGFVVSEMTTNQYLRPQLYACSTLDDALKYIKAEMGGE